METIELIKKLSKSEQKVAIDSYPALIAALEQINSEQIEIEIEETNHKIIIPLRALKLLSDILKAMSEGKPISIVQVPTEVTTQKAAEFLGCSRPHLVKLLEDGQIEFTKVGKHRRLKMEDVLAYKKDMKAQQKQHLINIMDFDDQTGLYDS